jgi:hypothetical protein
LDLNNYFQEACDRIREWEGRLPCFEND